MDRDFDESHLIELNGDHDVQAPLEECGVLHEHSVNFENFEELVSENLQFVDEEMLGDSDVTHGIDDLHH